MKMTFPKRDYEQHLKNIRDCGYGLSIRVSSEADKYWSGITVDSVFGKLEIISVTVYFNFDHMLKEEGIDQLTDKQKVILQKYKKFSVIRFKALEINL